MAEVLIRPKEVKPVIVKGKKAVPNDNSRLKWLDASGMNFKAARNHKDEKLDQQLLVDRITLCFRKADCFGIEKQ